MNKQVLISKQTLLFAIVSSSIYFLAYLVRIITLIKFKNNKKLLYVLLKLLPFILLIIIVPFAWRQRLIVDLFNFDFFSLIEMIYVNPSILTLITFIGELIIEIKIK